MPEVVQAVVAFLLAYAVGALPVAWVLVRRDRGVDMRYRGVGGTGVLNTFAVGGASATVMAIALELAKGAAVGAGARLYSGNGWFVAAAIAGCVAGDAFPLGLRHWGRGIVPLVSGLLVGLPLAGLAVAVLAVPTAAYTSMRGRVYEAVVLVAVPVGLLIGTRQWQSLVPAAIIVAVLLTRAALRRRRRETALMRGPAWRMVVDGHSGPAGAPRHNAAPWDSSSPTG